MLDKYYDKHGNEIKSGMFLKHDDGDVDRVYACEDEEGNQDLGFNASNLEWLERHGGTQQIYPLYQFNLKEWEIVSTPNKQAEVK